ncbi:MAG: cupin domain-containing protein [Steroidobacteraceae bacterium]
MGKASRESDATRELMADDPTVELDMLEQTISIEGARVLRHDDYGLVSSPIPRAWILEGEPVARSKRLTRSSDNLSATFMWDCTAGRFDWFYDDDEVIHVLEGSAVVVDAAGASQRLEVGDTFLFPAGSRYQWTVSNYVRRIGFLYPPLSREMRIIRGILKRLKAPFRRKPASAAARGS